jgi:hypothetical protein
LLRIIFWKAGIEWAHLKRAFNPRPDRKIYYFAFGANLSHDVLAQRRIKVFEAFDYTLNDAALRFTQPGFYKDHGYASADAADGEVVYGKIYLILKSDEERMDYFEGVPHLGAHEKVYCQADGFVYYFYRCTTIADGLKPTREYLDYLVQAYRQMDRVPAAYLESISATEVLDRLLPMDDTGVFVSDINRWPGFLHPLLVSYERLCWRLVESLWHRSPLQWMIKM